MSHDRRRGDNNDHDRGIRSEERLCQIDQMWIAHAVVHDLEAQALELQHTEYERRLSDLNHEAQRIAADKLTFASAERVDGVDGRITSLTGIVGTTLPREVFDTFLRETYKSETERRDARLNDCERGVLTYSGHVAAIDRNDQRLKIVEDWKARAAGFGVLVAILSGAVGAAIAKLIS